MNSEENIETTSTSAILPAVPSTSTEYRNASNETTSESAALQQSNFTFMDPPSYRNVNSEDVSDVINDLERFCSSSSAHESSTTSDCSIDQSSSAYGTSPRSKYKRKRNQKRQKKDDDASLFEQEIKYFRLLFSDIQFFTSDENIKKEFVNEFRQVRLNLFQKYYLKLKSG